MKSFLKKLTSVILCVLFVMPLAAVGVFAQDTGKCGCGNDPIIYVRGIASSDLVLDPGTDHEKVVFPPSTEDITDAVKKAVLPTLGMMMSEDPNDFVDEVADAIVSVFDKISLNPDGSSKYNVGIDWSYPTVDVHKTGGYFDFCYDWRLDTHTTAAKLHDYINYVKQLTGHDRIKLFAFSMGGAILTQYLAIYGCDDVDSVVICCGAQSGVACCGESFAGKMASDPSGLMKYFNNVLDDSDTEEQILKVVRVLHKTGVLGSYADDVFAMYKKIAANVNHQILINTFGTMPGMWMMIGPDDYEDAKNIVFSTAEERTKWKPLLDSIDDYHYNVQGKLKQLLTDVQAKTGVVGIISKYGLTSMPPTINDYNIQTDSTIETKSSSCGAVCAKLGSTLTADSGAGSDYVQAVDDGHDHISPDNVIDASTCIFPDSTWFVKGCEHSNTPDDLWTLINTILNSKTQPTVFDDPGYPQFMLYDSTSDSCVPLDAANSSASVEIDPGQAFSIKGFFDRIFDFIHMIMEMISSIMGAFH